MIGKNTARFDCNFHDLALRARGKSNFFHSVGRVRKITVVAKKLHTGSSIDRYVDHHKVKVIDDLVDCERIARWVSPR